MKRKIKPKIIGCAVLLLLAALSPSLPAIFSLLAPGVYTLGEKAAIISASLNMPKAALTTLRERFNGEWEEDVVRQEPPVSQTSPEASSQAEQGPDESQAQTEALPAEIPEEYRGNLLCEDLSADSAAIDIGGGLLRNYTSLDTGTIDEILSTPAKAFSTDTDGPQVLIFHTHTTEAYELYDNIFYDTRNTWRSTDNNNNMAAVGEALAQVLRDRGIRVVHDVTQHDYPSYNGSYNRSAETVRQYLQQYPSIQVVLDVHRDGILRDSTTIVKPTAEIEGQKAGQLMIISGCDDGTMSFSGWKENLRFAALLQNTAAKKYPGLCRPVFFCYRRYNMHLAEHSLLLEFGSNGNTLQECLYTAQLMGDVIADALLGEE